MTRAAVALWIVLVAVCLAPLPGAHANPRRNVTTVCGDTTVTIDAGDLRDVCLDALPTTTEIAAACAASCPSLTCPTPAPSITCKPSRCHVRSGGVQVCKGCTVSTKVGG